MYILYSCGEARVINLENITQCWAHSNYTINVSQHNLLGLCETERRDLTGKYLFGLLIKAQGDDRAS